MNSQESKQLSDVTRSHPAMLATLNWLSIGIAVVDEHGALLRANPAAAAELARAIHVKLDYGRLAGAHTSATKQLHALLRAAVQGGSAQPCMARIATAGCGELELLACPVEGFSRDSTRCVVVLLNEPQRAPAAAKIAARPAGRTATLAHRSYTDAALPLDSDQTMASVKLTPVMRSLSAHEGQR